MPAQIIGLRGDQANRSFALGDAPLTFGRNPDNSIVLTGARASRRHAEIRREGPNYVLADLGSANGTFVNGQRLSAPHHLRPGDTFEIGDDAFRFDAPAATDATFIAPPVAPVAPPTVPAGQAGQPAPPAPYQPPAAPPIPGANIGSLPNTPPIPAAAPARRGGISRALLTVLGLLGLVLVVGCIGGVVLLTRSTPTSTTLRPTAVAQRTPKPTEEGAAAPTEAAGSGEPVATREPVAGGADWTILVYVDGDNNLERDAINDVNEMELAGSTDQVKIVVQLDRIHQNGPEDDTSNDDWDTTKRFLIQQDDDKRKLNSEELEDLGELNMGDPQTLVDFVVWGVKEYPAQRYALILWDHGSSWAGIAFDDTDGEKGITMPELEAALRTAQSQTGLERFDLIGFDACLMAQLDVLQTVEPFGNVAVASAELEPNDGWAWDIWLGQLNESPTSDAATVARSIVDAYSEYYQNSDDDTVTLSAFDLTKLAPVREGLNTLSDAMINGMDGSYQAIAEARSSVDAYSQPKPEEFSAIDLGDFARLVAEQGAQDDVAEPAKALMQTIEDARIAEWHSTFHDRSTGMSIFFPQVAELYPDFYEQASPLPQSTSWASFLKSFYETGGQKVSAPEISELQISNSTVGFANPATLTGKVSGKDIAFVFFFVGIPNGDRTGVELTDINYIYPPGSSPNEDVPPWSDGVNDLSQPWDGTRWALSNGADTIPVLLGPTKYGTDLFGVEGLYTMQGSGEQITAGLLFEVRQGRAELQRIYGFPKARQETQPFEITPTAGDTFTAYLRTYTIKDGKPIPDFNAGQTITIGDQPLSALQVPAESGEYVAGFLVRDIAGHFNYQYLDITVDNSGAGQVNPVNPGPQPTAGPGAQSGTLAFSSAEGRFSLEYPDAWELLDTGKNQVFFYNPEESSGTYVGVEFVEIEGRPSQANQTILDAYAQFLGKEQDFQQEETRTTTVAGQDGVGFEYSYTDKNGNSQTGVVIAITSPTSGLSYAITLQALSADFEAQGDTFQQVLDSLTIE